MRKISVFRRLGFKMASCISLVGLLPLFIGLFFLFKSTESFIKDEVLNNLGMLAKNTKEEIHRFIESCVTDMKMLAESESMRSTHISVDKKLSEMKRIQEYYKRFEDITMIDVKGRVITSTAYNYQGEWKSKKWFQEAINGKVYISDAHIILDPYEVVVAIAVPLVDDKGKIQAAIVGQLNMKRIWEIVDTITIGNTGIIAIVNNLHYFIAHPRKKKLFQHAPFDPDKQSGVVNAIEPDFKTFIYSSERYVGNSEYEFPNWRVIVAQERRDALSNILRLKKNVVYVLSSSFLLVILMSIIVSKGVVKPIHTLIHGMEKVSDGDLNYKTNIKNRDEIGLLGISFNDMIMRLGKARAEIQRKTEALRDAFNQINELNVNLEKKVEHRTKELKEKQFQLIQSGKLAAIGQLGAGVAHELNNPMTGILGYTQYMLEKVSKENVRTEDISTFRKCLQHIENSTYRCRDIVQNLLQFARKSNEIFEPLNINNVIADTLSLIKGPLVANKIEVVKNLVNDVDPIDGNANQLQQVFINIILNAQQAMPKGGHLFISTRRKGRVVEAEFKDTGCGIAEEHIERIFEPFFTTKMDWKGTGLGLSICYDIIKRHNGNIMVSSKMGKGAIFTIILPVPIQKDDESNEQIDRGEGTCTNTHC
ncbi:MAG: HAMP domain-containing protein [Candidatus Jettenia caeni]|nr:HAMP domain-containing protein [Candidatus Jettenia caeni]